MNLLQTIQAHHESTGGSSGITIVELCRKSGVSIASVKPLLKELHNQGKIRVREGINNKLIFLETNA